MSKNEIITLDCTLREGGYLNNWTFGEDFIRNFVETIQKSGVEYIEVGFLKDGIFSTDQTLFNEIKDINHIIPEDFSNKTKISAMIMVDEFDVNKIVQKTSDIKLDCIRLSFKKHQVDKIYPYLNKIKEAGYELFINPTYIDDYSDLELIKLFDNLNEFMPDVISIVDTNGFLTKNDVSRIYYLSNNHFDRDISFCAHFHNNLHNAFVNANTIIEECANNRNLIIDSTIMGIGRGVGNLLTEQIMFFLNQYKEKQYEIVPILKILDEDIYPIFNKTPWGNSSPFYLAKMNNCLPHEVMNLLLHENSILEAHRIIAGKTKVC